MSSRRPRFTREEFASKGKAIFSQLVLPRLKASDDGAYVAIDIESSAFEVDADPFAASERLLARVPNAQIWQMRAGRPALRRFGGRQPKAKK